MSIFGSAVTRQGVVTNPDGVRIANVVENVQQFGPTIAAGPGQYFVAWQWYVHGDSCKIRAIAYRPGQQYDESDSGFSIWSAGVKEGRVPPVSETRRLSATPNPMGQETEIRYQLRRRSKVLIRICDVSGRTVAILADGVMKPGIYHRDWEVAPTVPNGVYFLSFQAGDYHHIVKLSKIR